MENPIKFDLPIPKHQQLADWIREKILTNEWAENYQLKSETEFATELAVSRGTVRKAISTLIEEDLIVRIHGRGTFVKQSILLEQEPTGRLAGFTRDLVSRGIPYTTDVLLKEIIIPSSEIADLLGLTTNQKIFHMKRLRLVQDQPVILIENHIVYDLCEGIEQLDFTQIPLYRTLEENFNFELDWAQRTYWAKITDKEIAECLSLKKGAPVMYLEELYHLINDKPAEFTKAWINAAHFYIKTRINRKDEKSESPGIYR